MGWMLMVAAFAAQAANERLAAPMPDGFKVGYQAAQGGHSIEERVPARETVENWTQMVTLQTFDGFARIGAHGFLDRLGGMMAQSCTGATVSPITDASDGVTTIATVRVDCPLNARTRKPETMFARAFEGAADMHVVQYAFRSTLTPAQTAMAERYLAGVHLQATR